MFAIGKRVLLFILVNLLVMVTVSMVLNLLGVRGYLSASGIDYSALMVFCLVWGMGGALISLALSRIMAKWMMGVKIIALETQDSDLQDLLQVVRSLSRSAGLPKTPEVGVYESPEVNAFATGPTRSRALVAVSTGLLSRMKRHELEGVLAHEISHIANGDMVTMTLVQGVINAFVMFLSRVIAFAVSQLMSRNRDDESGEGFSPIIFHITTFVLEIFFSILGSMVVAAFSRFREFRADAGGAKLAGADKMIAALESLRLTFGVVDAEKQSNAIQTLQISGHPTGLMRYFATHPSLEDRIARLQRSF